MHIRFNHIAGLLVLVFGLLLLFTNPSITGAAIVPLASTNIFISITGVILIVASVFLLRHEMQW